MARGYRKKAHLAELRHWTKTFRDIATSSPETVIASQPKNFQDHIAVPTVMHQAMQGPQAVIAAAYARREWKEQIRRDLHAMREKISVRGVSDERQPKLRSGARNHRLRVNLPVHMPGEKPTSALKGKELKAKISAATIIALADEARAQAGRKLQVQGSEARSRRDVDAEDLALKTVKKAASISTRRARADSGKAANGPDAPMPVYRGYLVGALEA